MKDETGGSKSYSLPEEVEDLEEKYGKPRELYLDIEMGDGEFHGLEDSISRGRRQDATLFILLGDKIVLIQKHSHPLGVYRAPSGTIKPGEAIEECAVREAYEETGLKIGLDRYLVRIKTLFRNRDKVYKWVSHVFLAHRTAGDLEPLDTREVKGVRLATPGEMEGEIRMSMLSSGSGGLRYRALLTDAALQEMRRLGYI